VFWPEAAIFREVVYKGNIPEDGLQKKLPWRWFTKETSLKMVYKGNIPEDEFHCFTLHFSIQ